MYFSFFIDFYRVHFLMVFSAKQYISLLSLLVTVNTKVSDLLISSTCIKRFRLFYLFHWIDSSSFLCCGATRLLMIYSVGRLTASTGP